jgi:hypothetical protein
MYPASRRMSATGAQGWPRKRFNVVDAPNDVLSLSRCTKQVFENPIAFESHVAQDRQSTRYGLYVELRPRASPSSIGAVRRQDSR